MLPISLCSPCSPWFYLNFAVIAVKIVVSPWLILYDPLHLQKCFHSPLCPSWLNNLKFAKSYHISNSHESSSSNHSSLWLIFFDLLLQLIQQSLTAPVHNIINIFKTIHSTIIRIWHSFGSGLRIELTH